MMINTIHTLSQQTIAEMVELTEQDLWKSYFLNISPELAAETGMHVYEVGGASAAVTEIFPNAFFNRVMGLGVHQRAKESMVDELVSIYSQYQVNWGISLCPRAQPAELATWLTARGFQYSGNLAKMIRNNAPPPRIDTDLRIERVDKHNLADFADVNTRAFGMPEWYTRTLHELLRMDRIYGYIAYADDTPAASALLFVSGNVGGLYNGATLPEYRRRGAQGALMARRIQDGLDLGCQWFSTETSEESAENPNPSFHNMLRTGFDLAYLRPNYIYKPE